MIVLKSAPCCALLLSAIVASAGLAAASARAQDAAGSALGAAAQPKTSQPKAAPTTTAGAGGGPAADPALEARRALSRHSTERGWALRPDLTNEKARTLPMFDMTGTLVRSDGTSLPLSMQRIDSWQTGMSVGQDSPVFFKVVALDDGRVRIENFISGASGPLDGPDMIGAVGAANTVAYADGSRLTLTLTPRPFTEQDEARRADFADNVRLGPNGELGFSREWVERRMASPAGAAWPPLPYVSPQAAQPKAAP